MSLSPITRSLTLAFVLVLATMVTAQTAQAHGTDLPFEFRFPHHLEKTTFSDTWGHHRPGGRLHKGTDLMAEKMTEVYAFADGVITQMGSSWRSGRYIIIEHAGGWDTYYIHLNDDNPGTDDGAADWRLTVAPGLGVGSHVEAGQFIGWSGDSGNAEGSAPHTHFELLHHGWNVNPYHVLVEAYRRDMARMLVEAHLLEAQIGID